MLLVYLFKFMTFIGYLLRIYMLAYSHKQTYAVFVKELFLCFTRFFCSIRIGSFLS